MAAPRRIMYTWGFVCVSPEYLCDMLFADHFAIHVVRADAQCTHVTRMFSDRQAADTRGSEQSIRAHRA